MNQVDAILSGHSAAVTADGPELTAPLERFPRAPHAEVVRGLTQVSGLRSTVTIATQWVVICLCMTLGAVYPVWWVWLLSGLVIATRQQALGVLLHEATHFSLYRNRTLNDVVSDLTIAFPLGMSTTLYRKTHFRHHRFVNTDQDQDLVAQREEGEWYLWPKSQLDLVRSLVRSVLGGNTHRAWVLYKYWAPWNNLFRPLDADFPLRARVLYLLSAAAVYSLIGWGIVTDWKATMIVCLLYAVPGFTLLNLINRIRATAEHIGTEQSHELNSTRTVLPTWLERLTIAPFNVSYHLEHHLFPSVPGRNLSRLHQHLMEDGEFRERAHITRSYLGFFRELMSPSATSGASATAAAAAAADDGE